jgi:hypothetical protein
MCIYLLIEIRLDQSRQWGYDHSPLFEVHFFHHLVDGWNENITVGTSDCVYVVGPGLDHLCDLSQVLSLLGDDLDTYDLEVIEFTLFQRHCPFHGYLNELSTQFVGAVPIVAAAKFDQGVAFVEAYPFERVFPTFRAQEQRGMLG